MHNGVLQGFHEMRRDLMLAIDPPLFAQIRGSTDSEVLFHLALTFGLADDPVLGLERAVGFVEETTRRHGIADPAQASIGVSDGARLWAVRYASRGRARTLFASADLPARREPGRPGRAGAAGPAPVRAGTTTWPGGPLLRSADAHPGCPAGRMRASRHGLA